MLNILKTVREIVRAAVDTIYSAVLSVIFPPRETELLVRTASFEELQSLVSPQEIIQKSIASSPSSDFVATALLPYRSQLVQACILEAKFHHNKKAQEFLGRVLALYLEQEIMSRHQKLPISTAFTIIPMPLGKARRRERGYNQVEEIAKFAQRTLQNSSNLSKKSFLQPELLTRTRETTPQMTLVRAERLQNMRSAFAVPAPLPSRQAFGPDRTYIVVDDVLTTGATLSAACDALRDAGATNILAIALAH